MTVRQNAFTLVEILVVLAIISILAALLFTAFSYAREGGRRTVCLSNEKQLYAAFQLYISDSGGTYPLQEFLPESDFIWTADILPIVAAPEIFHCPSDTIWDKREASRAEMSRMTFGDFGKTPSSSYIVNERCLTRMLPARISPPSGRVLPFKGTVSRPTSTILLCDGANPALGDSPYAASPSEATVKNQYDLGNILRDPEDSPPETNGCCGGTCNCNRSHAPSARHGGRANVLFFDGHVEAMPNAEWYFPQTPYLDPSVGGTP